MKTAHMFMTKEALKDMLFGYSVKIQIEDVITLQDGQIIVTLRGDDLPDECTDRSHQIRVTHKRDVASVDGEVYHKYTKEIKLR